VIFIEAVYFEDKLLGSLVDGILFVDSSRENIKRRAKMKNFLNRPMVERIISLQKKPPSADWTVKNNGNKRSLGRGLKSVWKEILKHRD
jgi:dephospho-CoA kinase